MHRILFVLKVFNDPVRSLLPVWKVMQSDVWNMEVKAEQCDGLNTLLRGLFVPSQSLTDNPHWNNSLHLQVQVNCCAEAIKVSCRVRFVTLFLFTFFFFNVSVTFNRKATFCADVCFMEFWNTYLKTCEKEIWLQKFIFIFSKVLYNILLVPNN